MALVENLKWYIQVTGDSRQPVLNFQLRKENIEFGSSTLSETNYLKRKSKLQQYNVAISYIKKIIYNSNQLFAHKNRQTLACFSNGRNKIADVG
ncbi:hypothetical protein QL285_002464 [Trifolium repens]|nr:hypothetical protein QL285_002464 [Trifolium repens]